MKETDEKIEGKLVNDVINHIENDGYVVKGQPVYTLRECLMMADEHSLKLNYDNYKIIFNKKLKSDKNITKDKLIDFFVKETPKHFEEFFEFANSKDIKIIDECAKNKKTVNYGITLLSNGFMFGFENGKETVYVIPQELLEVYKESFTEEKKLDKIKSKILIYVKCYLLILSVAPMDFIHKLILERLELDLTVNDIKNIIKELGILTYKNKYYTILEDDDANEWFLDEALFIDRLDYIELDFEYALSYSLYIYSIADKISKIVKNDNVLEIFPDLLMFHCEVEDHLKNFEGNYKLNKKQLDKLRTILEKEHEDLRFWNYYGHTCPEVEEIINSEFYCLKTIPKKLDLISCLKCLSEQAYEEIADFYDLTQDDDINLLKEEIIQKVTEISQEYEYEDLKYLLYLNSNNEYEYLSGEVTSGFAFIIEKNQERRIVFPQEVVEILKMRLLEKRPKMSVSDLMVEYVHQNGVIEKKVLKDLLKKYEDVDLTIKELDEIAKEQDIDVYKNNYYSLIPFDSSDDFNAMLKLKEKVEYKRLDLDALETEESFLNELYDFVENEFQLGSKEVESLVGMISQLIKFGVFNDESLEDILEFKNIVLKQKQKNKLIDLVKKYKNDISVWIYNGYTFNEMLKRNSVSTTKQGRNELCQCGSGKKYKKCCGK